MYCGQCGDQIVERPGKKAKFCMNCGAPLPDAANKADVTVTAGIPAADSSAEDPGFSSEDEWDDFSGATEQDATPLRARLPYRSEPEHHFISPADFPEQDERTRRYSPKEFRVGLGIIVAMLLVIVVLLLLTLTGDSEKKMQKKEETLRRAIQIVDVSAYPDCREMGYIETWVGDMNGDRKAECLGIYGDLRGNGRDSIRADVMDVDVTDCGAWVTDDVDEIFDVTPIENGAVYLCIYTQDGDLCVRHSGVGDNGSRWFTRDLRYSIRDGMAVPVYDFEERVDSGPNGAQVFIEHVSGQVYYSAESLADARAAFGVDEHSHGLNDRDYFPEGHILVLYRNRNYDEPGDSGYLLLRNLHRDDEPEEMTVPELVLEDDTDEAETEWVSDEGDTANINVDPAYLWNIFMKGSEHGYWPGDEDGMRGAVYDFYINEGAYSFLLSGFGGDMGNWGEVNGTIVEQSPRYYAVPVHYYYFEGGIGDRIEVDSVYYFDLSELDDDRIYITTDYKTSVFKYSGNSWEDAEAAYWELARNR